MEDKNKLVKQNLFPFFEGILNHFLKKKQPSRTRFLVDSSELRDYHLTAMSEMCGLTYTIISTTDKCLIKSIKENKPKKEAIQKLKNKKK